MCYVEQLVDRSVFDSHPVHLVKKCWGVRVFRQLNTTWSYYHFIKLSALFFIVIVI